MYETLKHLYAVMKNGEHHQSYEINWNLMFAVCLLPLLFIFDPASVIVSSYVMFLTTIFKVVFVIFCAGYLWNNFIVRRIHANAFKNVSSEIQLKMNIMNPVNSGLK